MVKKHQKNGGRLKKYVTAIIQARMQSKRLPEKAIMEISGKPMIQHIIENAKAIEAADKVVLATGFNDENKPLIEIASSLGIEVFVGSEDNVLERYYYASNEFGGDLIIRITADNPLVDHEYASMAVDIAKESNADLCSIANIPLGTAVEVIKKEALDKAYEKSNKPYHFEHVTPYIKKHSELFHIERHPVNFVCEFKNLRLTVDTQEDLNLIRIIYDELYKGKPIMLNEVIKLLNSKPELTEINSKITQRPMTYSEIK